MRKENGEERARRIVTLAIQRVASEQTAESVVSVLHLPSGRHEGPDHRPRGPQHPRLRVGHRREPDHRRHARGGAAVLLRSGPPRGRPADPGEARPRRAHPPAADRGDARAQQGRGRTNRHPGRRGRARRGRHHRHAPRADQPARPAEVPDVVRPERPAAPDRGRAPRRRHGRRAAAADRARQALHAAARHRQGARRTRSRAATR